MIILKKLLLALSGLFICVFLIAHFGANLLLLLPEEQARPLYNSYSATLRGSPLITIVAYVNYACIIAHMALAGVIVARNRRARPTGYERNEPRENSTWTSQNMALLGSALFAFIVIHMANFWYPVKFLNEDQDLYQMVVDLFKNPVYLVLYTGAMLPLGLHLSHGVKSAFKSMGFYHAKYLRWIAHLSAVYALVLGVGFALIPIVLYFR